MTRVALHQRPQQQDSEYGSMREQQFIYDQVSLHRWLQVMRPALLAAGFRLVALEHLEVTDDVSIIEAMHEPVQITTGSYSNIKVRIVFLGC